MFDYTDKIVLLTGATGGIGRQIAKTLHTLGATLALADMKEETLQAFQEELKERVSIYPCNLSDPDAPTTLVKAVLQDFGRIDVLINNAGITRDTLAMRMTDDQWDMVLNINLSAGFKLIRAALPAMMKARFGRVVSLASIVGAIGNAGQANYAASKGGLMAMTKSIAQEVASRGITLNCIAPGFVQTPMTDALPDTVKEALFKRIPMGRFGTPQDIANTVAFLASTEAGYITGQTVHVNGGMVML